jgi:two-component system, LytTR family, response regulator
VKVLVIDNEESVRKALVSKLIRFNTIVTSIHEANGVASGKLAIKDHQPEIVFLDVEMDDGTGFDLLDQLSEVSFQLIFVTAHDKYAITAFRMNALDFLLKPIDIEDLEEALNRAKKNQGNSQIQEQLQYLKQSITGLNPQHQRIVLKDMKSIYFVKVADIIHCESEGSYTTVFIEDSPKLTISRSLKELQLMLEPFGFIRPHNSFLVNKEKITRIDKVDGGWIVLDNAAKIPVSQRKWEYMMKELR